MTNEEKFFKTFGFSVNEIMSMGKSEFNIWRNNEMPKKEHRKPIEPLPCPFCGGKAVLRPEYKWFYYMCGECGLRVRQYKRQRPMAYTNIQYAKKKWNEYVQMLKEKDEEE